jgi:hypothetical protein
MPWKAKENLPACEEIIPHRVSITAYDTLEGDFQ